MHIFEAHMFPDRPALLTVVPLKPQLQYNVVIDLYADGERVFHKQKQKVTGRYSTIVPFAPLDKDLRLMVDVQDAPVRVFLLTADGEFIEVQKVKSVQKDAPEGDAQEVKKPEV